MNFNFLEDRSKEMEEEKAVEGENEKEKAERVERND